MKETLTIKTDTETKQRLREAAICAGFHNTSELVRHLLEPYVVGGSRGRMQAAKNLKSGAAK